MPMQRNLLQAILLHVLLLLAFLSKVECISMDWSLRNAQLPFTSQFGETATSIGNRIFVLGGCCSTDTIWTSTDGGATWSYIPKVGARWSARYFHAVTSANGVLFVFGGQGTTGLLNDVWRSDNQGMSWTRRVESAGWSPRINHAALVLNDNSMVVLAGMGAGPMLNDVWRSVDGGSTWTSQTNNADWSPRVRTAAVVLGDDTILVLGGFTEVQGSLNDVWRSSDRGANWVLVRNEADWSKRQDHAAVVMHPGTILVLGGFSEACQGGKCNDIWMSSDSGVSWSALLLEAAWSGRGALMSGVLNDGSIFVVGGLTDNGIKDAWCTNDNTFAPAVSPKPKQPINRTTTTTTTKTTTIANTTTTTVSKTVAARTIINRSSVGKLTVTNSESQDNTDLLIGLAVAIFCLLLIVLFVLFAFYWSSQNQSPPGRKVSPLTGIVPTARNHAKVYSPEKTPVPPNATPVVQPPLLDESLESPRPKSLKLETHNDEGILVLRGIDECAHLYYCGRRLGMLAIPGSDGQCGPYDGPQCASCRRFQITLEMHSLLAARPYAQSSGDDDVKIEKNESPVKTSIDPTSKLSAHQPTTHANVLARAHRPRSGDYLSAESSGGRSILPTSKLSSHQTATAAKSFEYKHLPQSSDYVKAEGRESPGETSIDPMSKISSHQPTTPSNSFADGYLPQEAQTHPEAPQLPVVGIGIVKDPPYQGLYPPNVDMAPSKVQTQPVVGVPLEKSLQVQEKNEITLIVKPGSLGVRANWSTGKISNVSDGSQCSKNGIKAGWIITKVNGQSYSEQLLDSFIRGTDLYRLTFINPGIAN